MAISPESTSTYALNCTADAGAPAMAAVTLNVTMPAPSPTVLLSISSPGVPVGGAATLSWSSTNATTCLAAGGWTGPRPVKGTVSTGPLNVGTTYSLSCTGPGGTGSASAIVSIASQTSIVVTPRNAALTLSQLQQFVAASPGGGPVTWTVDGVIGGNATAGTISASGVYAPPPAAGTHTVLALDAANPSRGGSAAIAVTDLQGIYTFHNDGTRRGANLKEYALTPASLASGSFGNRWSCAVDGDVFGQPLYLANFGLGGGTHNVLLIVTQNNSVYAFDADDSTCKTYWTLSAMPAGATPVPYTDLAGCSDIINVGITGTPVIDSATKTLYFVTKTKEAGAYFQRLHAVDLATGAEMPHSPAVIMASVNGTGSGGSVVAFSPLWENQRPGLALYDGAVYIGWASHCDINSWWGWMMKYDESSLSQQGVLNVAPNGNAGGIWMSAGAPAFDSTGNLFVATGNGSFSDTGNVLPALQPTNNFSMSFLNLSPATLTVQDFYTPSNEALWSGTDADIASAGVVVLPDGIGPSGHPNLLLGADKQSHVWLLDRAGFGQFDATGDTRTVQYLTLPGASVCNGNCILSTPAYYNGTVYVAPTQSPLLALKLTGGLFDQMSGTALPSASSHEQYGYPGTTPTVSASPAGNGIVWVLDNSRFANQDGVGPGGPAVLRAYSADDLSATLYSSDAVAADKTGGAVKFTVPLVANGHVYVAGTVDPAGNNAAQITVYGLAP